MFVKKNKCDTWSERSKLRPRCRWWWGWGQRGREGTVCGSGGTRSNWNHIDEEMKAVLPHHHLYFPVNGSGRWIFRDNCSHLKPSDHLKSNKFIIVFLSEKDMLHLLKYNADFTVTCCTVILVSVTSFWGGLFSYKCYKNGIYMNIFTYSQT